GTDANPSVEPNTPASLIEVGVSSTATLTLDGGTTITGGTMTIGDTGEVYVQNGTGTFGATLDGVAVSNGGEIGIGGPVSSGSTLILDDGTTISGGTLVLDGVGDLIHVEAGANGPGATLH